MRRSLAHLYPSLSDAERFELFIKAKARGDEPDERALLKSSPKDLVGMAAGPFVDRCEASRQLATVVMLELRATFARLDGIARSRELLAWGLGRALDDCAEAYFHGARAANPERDPTDEELAGATGAGEARRDRLLAALDEAREEVASDARATYHAFACVCREEMALEPEVVLEAHFGPLADGLALQSLVDVEPAESWNERRDQMRSAWHRWRGAA